jgi:hypothetical protein
MDKAYAKFIERLRVINAKMAEIKDALKTMDPSTAKSWRSLLNQMDADFRETRKLIQHVHNDGVHFRLEDELDADLALKNLEHETKYALHRLLTFWSEQNYYVY